MNCDRSVVCHRETLDSKYIDGFSASEPWFFEADGPRGEWILHFFESEEAACAYQRQWRKENGFDEMTGQAVTPAKDAKYFADWLAYFEEARAIGCATPAQVRQLQLDLLAACYSQRSVTP
jgi:hypothetical protein